MNWNQKSITLTLLLLLSPLFFFAQSLTGLWTGTLTNDSNSIRKDQSFEIVLTEYRGKVYGYSRSEFIVNDTLYYIMKRVKGTIEGDVCEVKDDEIISYNFPGKLDKGVKVTSTFYRNKQDSTWHLDGSWKTNKTKNFYSVTGTVAMKGEKDLTASKIFPHLEELKLADDVAFYKESKRGVAKTTVENKKHEVVLTPERSSTNKDAIAISNSKDSKTEETKKSELSSTNDTWVTNKDLKKPESIASNQTNIPRIETKSLPASSMPGLAKTKETKQDEAVVKNNSEQQTDNSLLLKSTEEMKTDAAIAKQDFSNNKDLKKPEAISPNKKDVAVKIEPPLTKKGFPLVSEAKKSGAASASNPNTVSVSIKPIVENKEIKTEPVANSDKKNETVPTNGAAALISERKSELSQVVNFKSDSLELALYDNGEIDGDTVSVLLNGQIILAKQGLKASAIKKTIYITSNMNDEFTLLLYAENLGKYPPNTGLLVVHDGDDVYNVRFSADLQKNAGVVFRRKK